MLSRKTFVFNSVSWEANSIEFSFKFVKIYDALFGILIYELLSTSKKKVCLHPRAQNIELGRIENLLKEDSISFVASDGIRYSTIFLKMFIW